MQLGQGVEWALHCCVVLGALPHGAALPASRLAEYHGVPPAYLAKHLQALSQAGIVESVAGRRGGYRLAREPGDISLLDVVDAVEGETGAFRCTEIRRRGPTASPARYYQRPCAIAVAMERADAAWRAELQRQTIAELMATVRETVSPVILRRARDWFEEVLP